MTFSLGVAFFMFFPPRIPFDLCVRYYLAQCQFSCSLFIYFIYYIPLFLHSYHQTGWIEGEREREGQWGCSILCIIMDYTLIGLVGLVGLRYFSGTVHGYRVVRPAAYWVLTFYVLPHTLFFFWFYPYYHLIFPVLFSLLRGSFFLSFFRNTTGKERGR